MQTLHQLRARPHLSVSQLKMFLACPRSFTLRYVERLEPAFRPVSLALGTSLHRALGHQLLGIAKGNPPTPAGIREVLREALDAEFGAAGPPVLLEDDESEEDVHKHAALMLEMLLANLPVPEKVLGVEVAFSLQLSDPDTGRALDRPLIGAIDAVTQEQSGVVFVELKTGLKRWSSDQQDTDLQLTAYWQALRERGYKNPRARLAVVTKAKAPSLQLESPPRGAQHQRDLAAVAAGVLKAVAAGVDFPNRSHFGCKICPYAGACR